MGEAALLEEIGRQAQDEKAFKGHRRLRKSPLRRILDSFKLQR
jgi:hypothetical protein